MINIARAWHWLHKWVICLPQINISKACLLLFPSEYFCTCGLWASIHYPGHMCLFRLHRLVVQIHSINQSAHCTKQSTTLHNIVFMSLHNVRRLWQKSGQTGLKHIATAVSFQIVRVEQRSGRHVWQTTPNQKVDNPKTPNQWISDSVTDERSNWPKCQC